MWGKGRAATKAEGERMAESKACCIPCLVRAGQGLLPIEDVANLADYDHDTRTGKRAHSRGYGSCLWHHRGRVSCGWSHAMMRAHFGPSLAEGSKPYHAAYGSEAELVAINDAVLAGTYA